VTLKETDFHVKGLTWEAETNRPLDFGQKSASGYGVNNGKRRTRRPVEGVLSKAYSVIENASHKRWVSGGIAHLKKEGGCGDLHQGKEIGKDLGRDAYDVDGGVPGKERKKSSLLQRTSHENFVPGKGDTRASQIQQTGPRASGGGGRQCRSNMFGAEVENRKKPAKSQKLGGGRKCLKNTN